MTTEQQRVADLCDIDWKKARQAEAKLRRFHNQQALFSHADEQIIDAVSWMQFFIAEAPLMTAELKRLAAKCDAMLEALRPFADAAPLLDNFFGVALFPDDGVALQVSVDGVDKSITYKHLRAAAAATLEGVKQ